jgi:DNA-binding NarL/FixJ family response regulator
MKSINNIQVIVADDHPIVRFGICRALEADGNVEIVGEAADGLLALQLTKSLCPDVLIVDIEMPVMDGLTVIRQIRSHCLSTRILVVSAHAYDHYVCSTLSEGVQGYLLKDEAVEHVVDAVLAVAQGEMWLSPHIANKIIKQAMGNPPSLLSGSDRLTKREIEVLHLVAQGHSNAIIAESLSITERTVRFHIANLFSKFQVSSRIEVVLQAIRMGLVRV